MMAELSDPTYTKVTNVTGTTASEDALYIIHYVYISLYWATNSQIQRERKRKQ